MTDPRLVPLRLRWMAIDDELRDLSDGKVITGDGCPAEREGELLEELDAVEFDIGQIHFELRAIEKYRQ